MNYVCAFAFNPSKDRVVLIQKLKPDWQKGKLNGVGGKVEKGEDVDAAMIREFLEETGVLVDASQMNRFVQYVGLPEKGKQYVVYFYRIDLTEEQFSNFGVPKKNDVGELIFSVYLELVKKAERIPNLDWLIPLCLDPCVDTEDEEIVVCGV